MELLDNILKWVVIAIYGCYGVFTLFYAYNILLKKNFRYVNGFDEHFRRNLKNEEKFARDYSLPHILIGLSCVLGALMALVFGFSAMLYSFLGTIVFLFYGTYITRRMPERLRRGRYM